LSQYKINLDPGDKMILYTDGLIDYFGKKGAAPNKDNFYNTLRQLSDKPADKMVKGIMKEQQKLQKDTKIDDDISLLIIEYNGFKQ